MTGSSHHRFDLDLFLKLNKEYEIQADRSATAPARYRGQTGRSRENAPDGSTRSSAFAESASLKWAVARPRFATFWPGDYDCDAIGVDITEGKSWPEYRDQDGLELRLLVISQDDCSELGVFSRIVSWTVWEHIRHPFAALESAKRLLNDDGTARSPHSSLPYR